MQFLIYILLLEATNHLTIGWILLGIVITIAKIIFAFIED